MKFLKISLVAAMLLGSSTSCGSFFDINSTPNNPVRVPVTTLLPTASIAMAFANNNELNRFAEIISQHLAGMAGSPQAYDSYGGLTNSFDNQWDSELYQGTLTTAQRLIEESERIKSPAYAGIAKIIKAYTFAMVTDFWGDVPYSEALQGAVLAKPRVDKQEDIYKGNESLKIQSLFDLIREGIKNIDEKSELLPSATDDPVYRGNLASWKRAGYTLMLKLALQISSKEPALATTIINEAIASNQLISRNDQGFVVRFGTLTGSFAPFYTYTAEAAGNLFRNDMVMSKRSLDALTATNDPRLPLFFTRPGANYVTAENAFNNAPAPQSLWSRYGTAITGLGVGPVRLISNSHRAFIMAEAVVRLNVTGDAQALFREGIRASMEEAGVTPAAVDAFFAANVAATTLSGSTQQRIEQIIGQKWISLIGNGYESYNDWRRTGFPVLSEPPNPTSVDQKRPRRLIYTTNEINRNQNLIPAGTVPPQTNVRVWWDVN